MKDFQVESEETTRDEIRKILSCKEDELPFKIRLPQVPLDETESVHDPLPIKDGTGTTLGNETKCRKRDLKGLRKENSKLSILMDHDML